MRALVPFAFVLAAAPAFAEAPPWEIWSDLSRLAALSPGEQGLLQSSHCLSGCGSDRHSPKAWRYIRKDGDEGVVFEETGPGAITRLWMTMGEGVSVPLDPEIRIRIYVDDAEAPVVDLPLPELFSGETPPFLAPLVADRSQSSGGNVSYVPIPYRSGCRVTLLGADNAKIWFQFSSKRLASAEGVVSFTGHEDLTAWSALLASPGTDPWPFSRSSSTHTGELLLAPGEAALLDELSGPDSITALRLTLPASSWSTLELQADFDGERRVRMALSDYFAQGLGGPVPTRSLLVGRNSLGVLYSYFPMPFFQTARIVLRSLAPPGTPAVAVAFSVRIAGAAPPPGSGLFGAARAASDATPLGADFPVLDLKGEGRWVGVFSELGSVGTLARSYLEGDERVFVDGSRHPQLYGTGVEDFFGGGFYFDGGPFGRALHGSPYHQVRATTDVTAAYRLLLTDSVPFARGIRVGLEGGFVGDVSMHARIVAYYYLRRPVGLVKRDVLDLGLPSSRQAHGYVADTPVAIQALTSAFEGEPSVTIDGTELLRPPGIASFVLHGAIGPRVRIRRRFDAGVPWQRAQVFVNGRLAGTFPNSEQNHDRRWREVDLDVAGEAGDQEVEVHALPDPGDGPGVFTESAYELWSSPAPD
jgi:hypothetical protein